jgi:hypothetical protein
MKKHIILIMILVCFIQKAFAEVEIKNLKSKKLSFKEGNHIYSLLANYKLEMPVLQSQAHNAGDPIYSQMYTAKFNGTEFFFIPTFNITDLDPDKSPYCSVFILSKDTDYDIDDDDSYKLEKEIYANCDRLTSVYFFTTSLKNSFWIAFSTEYLKEVSYWAYPYQTENSKFLDDREFELFLDKNKPKNISEFKEIFKIFFSKKK